MTEFLKKHIAKFVDISSHDFVEIQKYFTVIKPVKKENLLVEGKVCKSQYFVNEGCLRMFFINSKGVEQTIQFALENWWLADYTSFSSQKPSDYFIQAVENSEVLALNFSSQDELLERFPKLERYFRLVHQRANAASQFRIKTLYSLSKEENYYQFNKKFPDFVQRIPQYLLASFLGFTPEYLSEIRGKRKS